MPNSLLHCRTKKIGRTLTRLGDELLSIFDERGLQFTYLLRWMLN
jgi:hypothetical protein